jgi:DNA-binding transcriptional LysR family regulator
MERHLISTDDGQILLALRNAKTLRGAARLLNCDPGGLLRKVQRIASENEVLHKNKGRWELSEKGLALVAWMQESILSQKKILRSETRIRIAATMWFAERALIPKVPLLKRMLKDAEFQFSVPDNGFEIALLEGDADFVVVCHPPENPAIAHKRIGLEKWSLVISQHLKKKHFRNRKIKPADLETLPFIHHQNLNPDTIMPFQTPQIFFSSMDNLIGVRAAILNGFGWSYVPATLVQDEIAQGLLVEIPNEATMDRHICLWSLRGSSRAKARLSQMESWLRESVD